MLSYQKSLSIPQLFSEATGGILTYEELMQDNSRKRKILVVLLNEQGSLCPFCERKITMPEGKRPATIDHFLPQSRFPDLQINYFNLIGTCLICNSDCKKDFIVPSYVHDPQFDSTSALFFFREGKIKRHFLQHEQRNEFPCILINPSYEKALRDYKIPAQNDIMLQATIDLFRLNERASLREGRSEVLATLGEKIKNSTPSFLLNLWKKYSEGIQTEIVIDGQPYFCKELQEYLSLKMEILKRRLEKHGIITYADFQQRLDALH
jgi:uncharacterized protein (TIGR02646 family)